MQKTKDKAFPLMAEETIAKKQQGEIGHFGIVKQQHNLKRIAPGKTVKY